MRHTKTSSKVRQKFKIEVEFKTPENAVEFCQTDLKRRCPELESFILTDVDAAYEYACRVIHGPWPEAEKIILAEADTIHAWMYAAFVLKRRWREAEPLILSNAGSTYQYACYALYQKRFKTGEPIIATDRAIAKLYMVNCLHAHSHYTCPAHASFYKLCLDNGTLTVDEVPSKLHHEKVLAVHIFKDKVLEIRK